MQSERKVVRKVAKSTDNGKDAKAKQTTATNNSTIPLEKENEKNDNFELNNQPLKKKYLSLNESVEAGKKILFEIESRIAYLYEGYFANRGFAYTAKEVVINFEEYLQAKFLIIAMNNRDLCEDEMRFIWSVFARADIFTGMDSIDQTYERANKLVKKTPHAILISVAVDKFYGKKETAVLADGIYQLYQILCQLIGITTDKKEGLLADIITFAQAQGVNIL